MLTFSLLFFNFIPFFFFSLLLLLCFCWNLVMFLVFSFVFYIFLSLREKLLMSELIEKFFFPVHARFFECCSFLVILQFCYCFIRCSTFFLSILSFSLLFFRSLTFTWKFHNSNIDNFLRFCSSMKIETWKKAKG